MSTPLPLRGTPRLLLTAAVWTLLLLGLLLMHGATSHGATAHASASTFGVPGLVSHDGHVSHSGLADAGNPVPDSGNDDGSPEHSAAELCLAILCAVLAALAAFGALTCPRCPLSKALRNALRTPFPSWLRPPDPPCLIRLSILRC